MELLPACFTVALMLAICGGVILLGAAMKWFFFDFLPSLALYALARIGVWLGME